MMLARPSSSASRAAARLLPRRAPCSDLPLPHSKRSISSSAACGRNLPARRPVDPLDTAPNAVRHRLPSGETFIVRPSPNAPAVQSAVDSSEQDAHTTSSSSSNLVDSLFPGFANSARQPHPSARGLGSVLPPPLRPRAQRSAETMAHLTPEKIQELRDLRLSTAASSAPGSDTSVRALAARYGVSTAFVRIIAPLPAHVRSAKLAEAEEQSGREYWGFKKRLAKFERRVRRELW